VAPGESLLPIPCLNEMGERAHPLWLVALAFLTAAVAVAWMASRQPTEVVASAAGAAAPSQMAPAPRIAAPGGAADFSYGPTVAIGTQPATEEESESKLFYTPDNRWWGVLGTSAPQGPRPGLYLFEFVDGSWQPRLRLPGADPWAKADTVFDSATRKLYVSARADDSPTSGRPRIVKLYELRYRGAGKWSAPAGPTRIFAESPESVTIDVDSRDRVWAAFMRQGALRVRVKQPSATEFEEVRVPAQRARPDDVPAIVAWEDGSDGRIGILWSDQRSNRFLFAWRSDQAAIAERSWQVETAYGGPDAVGGCPSRPSDACADDHISLKAHGGRVLAAVKTSLNDAPFPILNDPQIVVLERIDDVPTWEATPVSPVGHAASNPTLLLAPEVDGLYVFAPRGQTILMWSSSLSSPRFGGFVVWMRPGSEGVATTTQQIVTPESGAVVIGSQHDLQVYLNNQLQFIETLSDAPPRPVPAPTAGLEETPP
jgi:hypothetical protein